MWRPIEIFTQYIIIYGDYLYNKKKILYMRQIFYKISFDVRPLDRLRLQIYCLIYAIGLWEPSIRTYV